ncbi:MAG: GNAT family N-acetyltransferase [Rhodospirillaceae bacterium]|nr:GNAT family N-acetyltransferase [Rhodospirillaceae bacterium]
MAGPPIPLGISMRPAQESDARTIADLFRISSDGVADYVWSLLRAEYGGRSLPEIGAARYARENTDFSYQNCILAQAGDRIAGMVHGFAMATKDSRGDSEGDSSAEAGAPDPVLQPYAELEIPGSFYIAGLALFPIFRGRGIGSHLLDVAEQRARALRCPEVSLLAFAENDAAVRLYARNGYRIVKTRRIVPHALIRCRGDAYLMAKPVD